MNSTSLLETHTFAEQKTLKLTNSSNNKKSIFITIIRERTTEPAEFTYLY
jgi:hypothetical protein